MKTKRQTLITFDNPKTIKGEKLGYRTGILYLAPYTQNSKGINLCSHASAGCASACLFNSGFGGLYTKVQQARINKTEYFLSNRVEFMFQLKKEIETAIRLNAGKNEIVFRLNGTSDIPFEKFRVFEGGKNIFELFNEVQFYDYTKNHIRLQKELPSNYHLTYSRSETNHDKAMDLLTKGFNVAIVFTQTPKKYEGFDVVDGDKNDLTFLQPKGTILGLRYKKLTNKGADNTSGVTSGFVINTNNLTGDEIFTKLNKTMLDIKSKIEENSAVLV